MARQQQDRLRPVPARARMPTRARQKPPAGARQQAAQQAVHSKQCTASSAQQAVRTQICSFQRLRFTSNTMGARCSQPPTARGETGNGISKLTQAEGELATQPELRPAQTGRLFSGGQRPKAKQPAASPPQPVRSAHAPASPTISTWPPA